MFLDGFSSVSIYLFTLLNKALRFFSILISSDISLGRGSATNVDDENNFPK